MVKGKTSPRRVSAVVRQTLALNLRLQGLKYDEIAKKAGYATASAACLAVQTAMADLPKEAAEEVRQMELTRLDALQNAIWIRAMRGEGYAIDRILDIMGRRHKLLGLDKPVKLDVQVKGQIKTYCTISPDDWDGPPPAEETPSPAPAQADGLDLP